MSKIIIINIDHYSVTSALKVKTNEIGFEKLQMKLLSELLWLGHRSRVGTLGFSAAAAEAGVRGGSVRV